MGKIVGNFFKVIACMALFFNVVHAQVALRVVDMEGEQLEQAGVGQPFMLEVSITDMGKGLAEPEIKGDPRIVIHRTGLFMSTINGVSTTKYSYKLRIDEPGTFQLGPAIVMYQGAPVESNVLTINVAQQQKSKNGTGQKKAFLELKVDKDQVVVGQKINCTLTFYYTGNGVSLKQVGQPALDGFSKKEEEEPSTGTVKKDGELYKYVCWHWQLYPNKPGKLIIPAHRADYVVELKNKQQGFGAFGFFFGNRVEHERVYSNAEQIHVDALPAYKGQVDAIGSFKHIRAYIKPAVAKQGEAMVLTLEIEGDGDLRAIQPPKLKHMPKALRYYESKNYVVDAKNKREQSKKYFEYIIQGLKEGDWQISKQTFTYFDVNAYAYKTLETAPLMVQIMRNNEVQSAPPVIEDEQPQEQELITDDILPLNEQGPWRPVHERSPLTLWIFLLFMGIPFIGVVYIFIQVIRQRYYKKNGVRLRYERAFKHALSQLKKTSRTQNTAQIYHIMTQLFADRAQISNAVVTQDNIEQQLKNAGIPKNHLEEWRIFFNTIAAHAFGHTKEVDNHLFEQAKQWIEYLKEVL